MDTKTQPKLSQSFKSLAADATVASATDGKVRVSAAEYSKRAFAALLFVGNSGVGKSLLLNLLIGENVFLHKISASSVTSEVEWTIWHAQIKNVERELMMLNIPGLIEAEGKHLERNRQALTSAFGKKENHVVLFIFGNTNGRLNSDDVDAFKQLTTVYSLTAASLIVVFNQAKKTKGWQESILTMVRELSAWKKPFKSVFIEELNEEKDEIIFTDARALENRAKLISAIEHCTPEPHPKKGELQFRHDQIKLVDADLLKLFADMKKR